MRKYTEQDEKRILLSDGFKRTCERIIYSLTKRNDIPLKILWDRDVTAYTDRKHIATGVNHPMSDGLSLELKMSFIKGQIVHEIGHIFYTTHYHRLITELNTSIFDRLEGVLSDPLLDFAKRNPHVFMSFFAQWHNVLEDSYIEPKLATVVPGAAQEYLAVMRAAYYEYMQPIEDFEEMFKENKIGALMAAILQYGLYGKFKTFKVEGVQDFELYKLFLKGFAEIDDAINEENNALRLTKIIKALNPFEEELLEMFEDYDQDNMPDYSPSEMPDVGYAEAPDNGSDESTTSFVREMSDELREQAESIGGKAGKNDQEEDEESSGSGGSEEDASSEKTEENSGEGQGDQSEEEAEKQNSEDGKKDDDKDDSEEASGKKQGAKTEKDEPQENSNSESKDSKEVNDSGNESEEDKATTDLNDMFVPSQINLTEEEDISVSIYEEKAKETSSREITMILRELEEVKARQNYINELEIQETRDAMQLLRGVHHGVNLNIIRPISDDVEGYNRLVSFDADRMIRKYDKRQHQPRRRVYSGKNLNMSDMIKVKQTKRAFSPTPKRKKSIHFTILVDESGSMYGSRLDAAKHIVVMLQRYFDKAEIDYRIVGHTESYNGVSLRVYIDNKHRYKDDHLSLATIDARSGNRDGLAIRWCLDKAQEERASQKYFLIISDGQPAGSGYGGSRAVADMQQAIKDNSNIKTLAFSIGADHEIISSIYGEENTLAFTDLRLFQESIVKIIEQTT